jgi:hypothetical protein
MLLLLQEMLVLEYVVDLSQRSTSSVSMSYSGISLVCTWYLEDKRDYQ